MLSEESSQIVEQGREANRKGEGERYIRLNIEFQRIARRDMKAFLSEQCKEIEENNRMGKTGDFFKTGDFKGTFHARIGMIKDRNNKDLKEVQEIKKKTQEYREELHQKSQINTMKWSLTWSHISWNVKSSGP